MFFSNGGFRAFDGSSRYFKRLGIYDLDCCFLGSFRPDDGYYIVERDCDCCDRCIVVESVRWYAANGYAVGTVISCPDPYSVRTSRPNPPVNTATKKSLSYEFPGRDWCCNDGDGGRIYAELTEEISDANPLP